MLVPHFTFATQQYDNKEDYVHFYTLLRFR